MGRCSSITSRQKQFKSADQWFHSRLKLSKIKKFFSSPNKSWKLRVPSNSKLSKLSMEFRFSLQSRKHTRWKKCWDKGSRKQIKRFLTTFSCKAIMPPHKASQGSNPPKKTTDCLEVLSLADSSFRIRAKSIEHITLAMISKKKINLYILRRKSQNNSNSQA